MASEKLQKYEDKMNKTIDNLVAEYQGIRAGRANPHILDKIKVSYYGVDTPLQQVGNISVPEPKTIVISPWDATLVKEIRKAIMVSDIGINPSDDGKNVRLVFPDLTEERRKELSKDVKKKGEEAKVAIRNIRRDGVDLFKKEAKSLRQNFLLLPLKFLGEQFALLFLQVIYMKENLLLQKFCI